jgi:hypothetical protein
MFIHFAPLKTALGSSSDRAISEMSIAARSAVFMTPGFFIRDA